MRARHEPHVRQRMTQGSEETLIIDLRTSISKIKQNLIESIDSLHVSFRVPEIMFNPPTPATSYEDLHLKMKDIYEYIGITPQIVSIKKYVNCVMMCEKMRKLCVLWYFNGKIYFGEYLVKDE